MTREEALDVWAPEGSPWSAWAKAVLFAFLPDTIPEAAVTPQANFVPPYAASRDTALLVELAGARSMEAGLQLAAGGCRPVPLYNACPYASGPLQPHHLSAVADRYSRGEVGLPASVDVLLILRAIADGTGFLKQVAVPFAAPPAFLIDAHRHDAPYAPDIGWFDNRSVLRAADLPSAEFLKQHGIARTVLVQEDRKLRSDLRTVLSAWQEAGLIIHRQTWGNAWNPEEYSVPRPSLLGSLWDGWQMRFRFRPNSAGAFERFVHGAGG